MPDNGKGIALGSIAVGGILLWSAINNKKALQVAQNTVRGKPTQPGAGQPNVGVSQIGGGDTGLPFGTVGTSGAPTAPSDTRANVSLGRLLATPYGWSAGSNWNSLYALWERESGWDNMADNASSDAEGIPQALPYSKMPHMGWLPKHGGNASPSAQIIWGLGYIASRYGNPDNAWAHEQANGWY